jgi:hypothetical protein
MICSQIWTILDVKMKKKRVGDSALDLRPEDSSPKKRRTAADVWDSDFLAGTVLLAFQSATICAHDYARLLAYISAGRAPIATAALLVRAGAGAGLRTVSVSELV